MQILKVKEYNQSQICKWKRAVNNWDSKKGGFPNLCFYIFSTPQGTYRKKGFVIKEENSAHFCLTKKELENYITKGEKNV